MLQRIRKLFYLLSLLAFLFFAGSFYFSDQNIMKVNKIISTGLMKIDIQNLPLLENNTQNIITYSDEVEIFKKTKKKYKFWDLISNK